MRYSKFCLNAVFHEPLERSVAMKLVRSTRNLVLHEFRRYVRVPVMTEVGVVMNDGGRLTATSQEISTGGMSLKGNHVPELGTQVEVSFSLLTLPRVWVRGQVSWKKLIKVLAFALMSLTSAGSASKSGSWAIWKRKELHCQLSTISFRLALFS